MRQDHSQDFDDILESANKMLDTSDAHCIGLLVSGYYLFASGIVVIDTMLTPLSVDTLRRTAARLWREPDGILWLGGMVALMEQQLGGMSRATSAELESGKPDYHAAHRELLARLSRHDPFRLIPSDPPSPRVI